MQFRETKEYNSNPEEYCCKSSLFHISRICKSKFHRFMPSILLCIHMLGSSRSNLWSPLSLCNLAGEVVLGKKTDLINVIFVALYFAINQVLATCYSFEYLHWIARLRDISNTHTAYFSFSCLRSMLALLTHACCFNARYLSPVALTPYIIWAPSIF